MTDLANGRAPKRTDRDAKRPAATTGGGVQGPIRGGNGPVDASAIPAAEAIAVAPADAVARHLEWLELALTAARDELARREERLAKATKKNREKRTDRLAEVRAEVAELTALVAGLRELAARPVATTAAKPRNARSTSTKTRRVASAPRARRARSTPAAG